MASPQPCFRLEAARAEPFEGAPGVHLGGSTSPRQTTPQRPASAASRSPGHRAGTQGHLQEQCFDPEFHGAGRSRSPRALPPHRFGQRRPCAVPRTTAHSREIRCGAAGQPVAQREPASTPVARTRPRPSDGRWSSVAGAASFRRQPTTPSTRRRPRPCSKPVDPPCGRIVVGAAPIVHGSRAGGGVAVPGMICSSAVGHARNNGRVDA